jgi:hypothetical protein
MCHIACRPVAVDHPKWSACGIGELVKHPRRNVNALAACDGLAFLPEAHFARPLHDEVDLLLFLVVPWYLPAAGLERDISHAEVFRLHRRGTSHEILGVSARRIAPAFDFGEITDDHPASVHRDWRPVNNAVAVSKNPLEPGQFSPFHEPVATGTARQNGHCLIAELERAKRAFQHMTHGRPLASCPAKIVQEDRHRDYRQTQPCVDKDQLM